MDGCSASLAFLHERAEPRRGAGAIAIGTIDFRGIMRDGMGVREGGIEGGRERADNGTVTATANG